MSMTPTEFELAKRIGKAEAALDSGRRSHSSNCMVGLDLDYYGPCTCGADAHNARIEQAKRALNGK